MWSHQAVPLTPGTSGHRGDLQEPGDLSRRGDAWEEGLNKKSGSSHVIWVYSTFKVSHYINQFLAEQRLVDI